MKKFFGGKLALFIFAFPALLLFTIFVVFPLFPQLTISFQEHNGFSSQGWVGFENYREVLTSSTFWLSVKNTFIIVLLSLVVALPLSLIFALFMDYQSSAIRAFFKFAAVFPAVLSVTVISQMWVAVYEPSWGLLNSVLYFLGLGQLATDWLTNVDTVVVCVAIAFLWQYIGLNALLFYTGIKSIPKQYYEAALIDGAGFVRASWSITIPLLGNVAKYVLTISTLGSLAMFAHIRIMTAGGPGTASRSVIYQLYYTAFSASEFGVGSAIAILFVLMCLVVTFIINKFVAKESVEY